MMSLFEGRKVGLALGVGGARGAAHLGVMRALNRHGIKIHCVAGSSSGSIFGAIVAAGCVDRAEEYFKTLSRWKAWRMMFELRLPLGGGLITGKHIDKMLRDIVPYTRFDELKMPFAAVVTDLYSGDEVVLRDGDLLGAVKASYSVPGLFTPVLRDGRWIVDGGLVNAIPVAACREMGADIVIGVDVNLGKNFARHKQQPTEKSPSFAQVFVRVCKIIEKKWTQNVLLTDRPEILIQPSVGNIISSRIRHINFAIRAGEVAAERALREYAGFPLVDA